MTKESYCTDLTHPSLETVASNIQMTCNGRYSRLFGADMRIVIEWRWQVNQCGKCEQTFKPEKLYLVPYKVEPEGMMYEAYCKKCLHEYASIIKLLSKVDVKTLKPGNPYRREVVLERSDKGGDES